MKKGEVIKLDAEVMNFCTGYNSRDRVRVKIGENVIWLDMPKGSLDGRAQDVCKNNSFE